QLRRARRSTARPRPGSRGRTMPAPGSPPVPARASAVSPALADLERNEPPPAAGIDRIVAETGCPPRPGREKGRVGVEQVLRKQRDPHAAQPGYPLIAELVGQAEIEGCPGTDRHDVDAAVVLVSACMVGRQGAPPPAAAPGDTAAAAPGERPERAVERARHRARPGQAIVERQH